MVDLCDILVLIELESLYHRLIKVWNNLTDMHNRDLHLTKESSIAIDRTLEMMIKRVRDKILPIRTEFEKVLEVVKEKRGNLKLRLIDYTDLI